VRLRNAQLQRLRYAVEMPRAEGLDVAGAVLGTWQFSIRNHGKMMGKLLEKDGNMMESMFLQEH
jgi:hypothetical protein